MTTEERLEKLERELAETKAQSARAKRLNRHFLIGSIVCLGAIFTWAFLAQPSRLATAQAEGTAKDPALKEVRARSFVLEDENGKRRAVLGVDKDGPSLVITDENGKPRVTLGMSNGGPSLGLSDEKGKIRATLIVLKDGPCLHLHENDKIRVAITSLNDGPGLRVFDEKENACAGLVMLKGGVPSMYLSDDNQKIRAGLMVDKNGPELGLFDANQKFRVGLNLIKDRPRIIVTDESGKIIWQASQPITTDGAPNRMQSTRPASEGNAKP